MTALLKEGAVIALALLVSAGAVELLRDRGVLVPPPERVVEEFVREMSLERWEPARAHLTEALVRRTGPDSLRAFLAALERCAGRIDQVRGRPFFATGVAAEASVELTAADGDRTALRFPLSRERGLWKISRLDQAGGCHRRPAADLAERNPSGPNEPTGSPFRRSSSATAGSCRVAAL